MTEIQVDVRPYRLTGFSCWLSVDGDSELFVRREKSERPFDEIPIVIRHLINSHHEAWRRPGDGPAKTFKPLLADISANSVRPFCIKARPLNAGDLFEALVSADSDLGCFRFVAHAGALVEAVVAATAKWFEIQKYAETNPEQVYLWGSSVYVVPTGEPRESLQ